MELPGRDELKHAVVGDVVLLEHLLDDGREVLGGYSFRQ